MLNKLYIIWAAFWFAICVIPMLLWVGLTFWMPPKPMLTLFYYSNHFWLGLWSQISRLRLKIENSEKKIKSETYVLIGNHVNMLDIPFAGGNMIHTHKPLSKAEMKKVPFAGWMVMAVAIGVDRSSKESRAKSLEDMINSINEGVSVTMFPEGTRNKGTEPLTSFYNGAFSLAIKTQVPILPFVFLDSRLQMPPGKKLILRPGLAKLRYLDPVPTKGLTMSDLPAFKDKVWAIMEKEIIENDKYFLAKNKSQEIK